MPLIAIAQNRRTADYVESIRRAGGEPVEVVAGIETPEQILARVDGLMLTGGGDVDPQAYLDQLRPMIEEQRLKVWSNQRDEQAVIDLAELLTAADAFAGFSRAVDELMDGDAVAALGTVDDALALLPGEGNMRSIRSGALLASGATDAGIAAMRELVAERASWEVIIRGFVDKGFISLPEGLSIDRALE